MNQFNPESTNGQRRAGSRSRFTLIELLVAMAVLVVLMTILFQFLSQVQKAWTIGTANTRMYESARVVFDVLERDLQCAVASSEKDAEIPFYLWDQDTTSWDQGDLKDQRLLSFVARVDPPGSNEEANANLCEIQYQLYTGPLAAQAKHRYYLRRAVVCDLTPAGVANSDWDFYGYWDPATANWAKSVDDTDIHRLVGGVSAVSFTCYKAGGGTIAAGDPGVRELPRAVLVSITLFDEKLRDMPGLTGDEKRQETERTFTKMIYLRNRN